MLKLPICQNCCSKKFFVTNSRRDLSISENWEKACALFQEMEINGVQPDSIACAALMRAFNKGGQPSKVLVLAELMREKEIPLNDSISFEMVSACSL